MKRWTNRVVLLCGVMVLLASAPRVAAEAEDAAAAPASGVYHLSEFGDVTSAQAAREAFERAGKAVHERGGGLLILPPNTHPGLTVRNHWGPGQTIWERVSQVTVLDLRDGTPTFHLPQQGNPAPLGHGWTGMELRRVQDSDFVYWPWTPSKLLNVTQALVRGGSSVLRHVEAVSVGENVRIYPETIRGIFPRQHLNFRTVGVTPAVSAALLVREIGWDPERRAAYFVADELTDRIRSLETKPFELEDSVRGEISSKQDFGAVDIVSTHNTDSQAYDIKVVRKQYAHGDTFLIGTMYGYQGDVMSGRGDEQGMAFSADIEQDPSPFSGVVESIDWERNALVFRPGAYGCAKLATSRPIVNLNQDKWIAAGAAIVEADAIAWDAGEWPEGAGRIVGTEESGWSEEVVGRYFALAEPGEFLESGDGGSYMYGLGGQHGGRTYRWYPIRSFEQLPDGRHVIRVERIWYTVRDGVPTLYDPANAGRPLRYIIAPGAMVTDVADGWIENPHGRPGAAHPRTIRLAPGPDSGTAFDFEEGDPIVQAVGAEPRQPVGLRIRLFNKVPSSWPGGAIELFNWGIVAQYAGLQVGAPGMPTRLADALERRKEKRPAFRNAMVVEVPTEAGIRFNADVSQGALVFSQPHDAQPMVWRHSAGWTRLEVDPASGRMHIGGGDLSVPALHLEQGLSAGDVPARNLRGIDVPVAAGQMRIDIAFAAPEADARYSLTAQPSWVTAFGVTEKRADGFVVQFATAAPDGATLDWQLIR